MKFGIAARIAGVALIASTATAQKDIVDTAVAAGSFKTLTTAVTEAGLVNTLKSDGPFTVFAPTDDAFNKLGSHAINDLLKEENRGTLTSILTYHVVPGRITAADLAGRATVTTVNGQRLNLAFNGDGLTVDKTRIVATDISTSNGVIHVIDGVLMPETNSIPQIAQSAGKFNTLLAAAKAAGLVEALSGDGPFTVFAPTDDAFAKLGDDTIKSLLDNPQRLAEILKYHVVPGRIYASDVLGGSSAKTLQGANVDVAFANGGLAVNKSNIIATDIEASNGVIHVIDSVLIPQPQGRLVVGIYEGHLSRAQRAKLNLGSDQGILINRLVSGSGAQDAGIKPGDIILTINGKPATMDLLREAKQEAGFGGKLEFTIARTVPVEVQVERD